MKKLIAAVDGERFALVERKEPNLFREQFPYEEVPKILFEEKFLSKD